MSKQLKQGGLAALRTLGVLRIARELQRSRVVILAYHGVLSGSNDRADLLNHNFVAAAAFERHLRYLRDHYEPISLATLCACYNEGKRTPSRSVVVTFDDGFANNYSVAFPLLQKYAIPFTVFLTTGMLDRPGAQLWTERVKRAIYFYQGERVTLSIEGRKHEYQLGSLHTREESARSVLRTLKRLDCVRRDAALASIEDVCGRPDLRPEEMERYEFLTWTQVRAMASTGVEFGSHTVTHPILSTLDPTALASELAESKREIERRIGRECYAFAYPNGSRADFGVREVQALKSTGYKCAVSLCGTLNSRNADLYQLDRINIGREFESETLQAAMTGVLGRARTVREVIRA